jgi:hypothetical protein
MLSLNQGAFYNKKINSFKYLEKNKVYGNIKEGFEASYDALINTKEPNTFYGFKGGEAQNKQISYNKVLSKEQKLDMKYFYDTLGKYFEKSKEEWVKYTTGDQDVVKAAKYNTYMQNAIHGDKGAIIYKEGNTEVILKSSKDWYTEKNHTGGDDNPMNFKYFIDKYMNNIDGINKDIDKLMCIKKSPNDTSCEVADSKLRSLFERNIERNNKQKEYVDAKKEIDKLRNNKEEKIREINKYNIHMFAWSIAGISLGGIVLYCFFKK